MGMPVYEVMLLGQTCTTRRQCDAHNWTSIMELSFEIALGLHPPPPSPDIEPFVAVCIAASKILLLANQLDIPFRPNDIQTDKKWDTRELASGHRSKSEGESEVSFNSPKTRR